MDGVNTDPAEFKELSLRERFRPRTLIVVPTNSRGWRDSRQLSKNVAIADIATVEDVIASP